MQNWLQRGMVVVGACALMIMGGCAKDVQKDTLTIYSGRKESLVGALVEEFEKKHDIDVQVKYGGTAELAALIMQEGEKSPADLFFAQDAGALGAVAKKGLFSKLPQFVLDKNVWYETSSKAWVGTSGRERTVVYNTDALKESDLPDTIFDYCDEKWRGKIGWAPGNGSFQAYVTNMRVNYGEEKTKEWLTCIRDNEPKVYAKNSHIVQAAGNGDVAVGFVNHYYLYRFLAKDADFPAKNHRPTKDGSFMNVAGVGVLASSDNRDSAEKFTTFLLSDSSQKYFVDETKEFSVTKKGSYAFDKSIEQLNDLEGTLSLLKELEIL